MARNGVTEHVMLKSAGKACVPKDLLMALMCRYHHAIFIFDLLYVSDVIIGYININFVNKICA